MGKYWNLKNPTWTLQFLPSIICWSISMLLGVVTINVYLLSRGIRASLRAPRLIPGYLPPPTSNTYQVMHLDAEKEMMSHCVALLGKFIVVFAAVERRLMEEVRNNDTDNCWRN
ncbi:PREDICTED: uncharacterized protein LOC109209490 [Nicotiana attenuata]|uniref:uncharacterized protein LOC109209490 n=1 Tax=Nicotiana attenuata TaxID=49451 RepID=UPI000904A80A|nr:PREDICTED: uncharacterized protein LOC109209490 [Nicotiana attenuata]